MRPSPEGETALAGSGRARREAERLHREIDGVAGMLQRKARAKERAREEAAAALASKARVAAKPGALAARNLQSPEWEAALAAQILAAVSGGGSLGEGDALARKRMSLAAKEAALAARLSPRWPRRLPR